MVFAIVGVLLVLLALSTVFSAIKIVPQG